MARTVAAVGGNALQPPGEATSVDRLLARADAAARMVAPLAKEGPLVVTHGNGPQVGSILASQPQLPMWMAVAESQGQLGSVLAAALRRHGVEAACLVTHVTVERPSPGAAATKPVGPWLTDAAAKGLRAAGVPLMGSAGRWRRAVPSPPPLDVVEVPAIRHLLDQGVAVVAAGGGGIPVVRDGGRLEPVDAVVDKDLASAVLARRLAADALLLLTDVPKVFLDFGKPAQRPLDELSAADARRYLAQGQFPAGSMGPKVQAALQFLDAQPTGQTTIASLADPWHGTRITP